MAECGQLPKSVVDALASALVKDADGNVSLNLQLSQVDCESLEPFIDCNNNHIDSGSLLTEVVGVDDCSLPVINVTIPPVNLNDLADVETTPVNGAALTYDSSDQTWKTRISWDDLRITPGSFDRPGISDPAYVAYAPNGGGLTVYVPEFDKDDFVSFAVQLPHGYAEGEDIYVHLHWTPGARGVAEAGNLVGWKLDYSWANYGENFADMQTINLSDACDGVNHRHQMASDVLISGAGKHISSMILCNQCRTDSGADDTWATNTSGNLPLLLEVDFHVPHDTQGSATHSSK